jgi:hypothetical protein
MDIYVPSNKIAGVKRNLVKMIHESNDPKEIKELKNTLKHIKSHNTSTVEVKFADKNPEKYASDLNFSIFKNELIQTTVSASAGSALMTGVFSYYNNYYAMADIVPPEQRLSNVVKDTCVGAGQGAIIGATSSVIRYSLVESGSKLATKSNVATSVAYGLFNTGVVVYEFATGKITDEEAVIKLGKNGASTIASIYTGLVVGAMLGPVGAIVGALAGYLITTMVYQSCTEILENAKLAEQEAQRVIGLCEAATKRMNESREEFEKLFVERFDAYQKELDKCFEDIDNGISSQDFVTTSESLARIAGTLGKELKLLKAVSFLSNNF